MAVGAIARGLLKVGGAATVTAGAAGLGAWTLGDEGTQRSARFWYNALPVYVHYRSVEFRNKELRTWGAPSFLTLDDDEASERYEHLHDTYTDGVRDLVWDMRGFYLKNAQFLSTRDDFIPPQYMKWCKETQDQAPTEFAPGEAKAAVDASMIKAGMDPERVFEYWDPEPIGCASIGQVHRAVLRPEYGGGQSREVVVKVQAPGIERRFRADIRTLIDFCTLAMPQHVKPLTEIESQFLTEFDYVQEAANLEIIRKNILPKWGHVVHIPEAVSEVCTKEVLVMEKVEGKKLADGLKERYSKIAAQQGMTLEEMEEKQKQKLKGGEIEASSIRQESRRTWLANQAMTFKDATLSLNPLRFLYNISICRLITGRMEYKWSEQLIDLGALIKAMVDVHAHQIFHDGVFNGDPHPGNILLMPDGRLGLIDYGQVKHISEETRVSYAKLIVALCVEDRDQVQKIMRDEFGGRSKYSNKDICYRLSQFWCDRDTPDVTGGRNLQEFIDWAEAEDPVVESPLAMVMISRVSVMIRGLGNAFNIRLRVAPAWRDAAERLLKQKKIKYPPSRLRTKQVQV